MKYGDRVKETTTVTGTGAATLLGAVSQFVAFSSVYAVNDLVPYAIVGQTGTEWEVGIGILTGSSTLARTGTGTAVTASSNAGALVSFSAGTKDVFVSVPGREAGRLSSAVWTDTDGATVTFNLDFSNQHQVTLGGNRTLALSGGFDGQVFTIILKQDITGGRTVTWFAGINWLRGGSVPVLSTAANSSDAFTFLRVSSGVYIAINASFPLAMASGGLQVQNVPLAFFGGTPTAQQTTPLSTVVPAVWNTDSQAQLQFLISMLTAHNLPTFHVLTPKVNLAYDVMVVPPPSPYILGDDNKTRALRLWADDTLIPQCLANVPATRGATRYFSQAGSDGSGDGLTPGTSWKTLSKANAVIAASSGDLRLRFNRGDVWREDPTLTVGKNNVTVDAYGTGAKPIITGFIYPYTSGWTNVSGNQWSRTEATTPGWVRAQSEQNGVTFDPLKQEDTAAHCLAFPKSWAYVGSTLYLNTGGPDPNAVVYEMCPTSNSLIQVTGDNVRLENLVFHGVGMVANGVGYNLQVFHSGSSGVFEFVAVDCDFIYSGYHAVGHISGDTNRVTLLRVRAGYCKNQAGTGVAGSGDVNPFVSYAGNGGQEFIVVDCTVIGGGLPSWDWAAQVGQQHGSYGIFQHTDDVTSLWPKMSVVLRTVYANNPYQVVNGTLVTATPSANDLATECRAWIIGEVYNNYSINSKISIGGVGLDRMWIDCVYRFDVDAAAFAAYGYIGASFGNNANKNWVINCTVILNITSGSSGSGVFIFESVDGGVNPINSIYENCRFSATGLQRVSSVSLGNFFGTRARFRNCEIDFEAVGSSPFTPYGLVQSTDTPLLTNTTFDHCAYSSPNDHTAFPLRYPPAISTDVWYATGTPIPNTNPGVGDLRYNAGVANGLKYDQNGVVRDIYRYDIGPLADLTGAQLTAHTGTALVDFGAAGATNAQVVITGQPTITVNDQIRVWVQGDTTSDHSADEHLLEDFTCQAGNIVANVGFTIYVRCALGFCRGKYQVQWSWE